MNYQTFEPSADLQPFVQCYWTLDDPSPNNSEKQTIVPDGCIEMIFHYGDLYKQFVSDIDFLVQPRAFVIGQLTRPLQIQPIGVTGIFSVRFKPDGFTPFATVPFKALENTAIAIENLYGINGVALVNLIIQAPNTSTRITHVEQFLSQLLLSPENKKRIIQSVVEVIVTANGQLSIDSVSEHLHMNRRKLEREFSKTVGLSPKQLSKTIRLQTALKMLLNKKYENLAELAHANEYYDQAHFIKDFKEFTGTTPREFYGDALKMTTLFIQE